MSYNTKLLHFTLLLPNVAVTYSGLCTQMWSPD